MRIRNIKNASAIVNDSIYVVKEPEKYKGKYHQVFGNDNKIYLEIGMGKGTFIIKNAINNPGINFIGIEKYDSIVVRALKKIDEEIPNLRIIIIDALNISNVFFHEIDRLYLNFSDPWPKKRHQERRLTSITFLKLYDNMFKSEKDIIFKTDNDSLFESSLISLNNYGYQFKKVILDLHNSDEENIETEYETKFSALGFKIKYLEAFKK